MASCERCGHYVHEDDVINADEFGYSELCEDCADTVIVYDEEDEEE